MSNVTMATFAEGCRSAIASPALTQWSYGQVLEFSGIDLPDNYTVYFALSRTSGDAQAMIGDANGVQVPNNLLCVGHSITAWVFLTDGTSGQREYTILIPVDPAAAPATEEPTPEQASAINQSIAALNAGVTRAETAADAVEDSAQAAAGSATSAAEDAAAAAGSASDAGDSADAAAGSASAAGASAAAAAASEQAASASEQAAAASATAAEGSAAAADARADAAALSATEAAASATDAAQSAGAAAQSATAASGSATAAAGSASDAAGSASAAAASATAAAGSAATAEGKAGEAFASAADAATAETGAQAAQTAAEAAQAAAETAQGEAEDAAQSVSESAAQIATNTADISDLKSAITSIDGVSFLGGFAKGRYIYTNRSIGTDISSDISTPQTNNALSYVIINCTPGTKITLNAYGWSNGRLWAFVDSSNKLLSKSASNLSATNLVIIAPTNAAKCIINSYTSDIGSCYIGTPVDNRIADTDKTLTVENKSADGKATGDKIKEANAYTDSVKAYIIPEYAEMEQGIVNSSTGERTSNQNAVRTKQIPVLFVQRIVKPKYYRVQYAAYDEIGQYVTGSNMAQTQNFDVDNFGKTILTNNPTVKTIVVSFIYYPGDSASPMSVADYYETNNKLYVNKSVLWDNASIVCDELNNVIVENITLDASTSLDVITGRNFYKNAIVSIDATATLAGDDPVTISATRRWSNRTGSSTSPYFASPEYVIGENGKRKNTQFRLPSGVCGMDNKFTITVTVPSDSSVAIHSMSIDFDDVICRDSAIQMNAHGRCGYGGPANTEISFVMAAKLGYRYCIAIPKVTNDGKYVCFHDDDNIQGALYNPDGSEIDEQYQNRPISDFDYDDLMAFDAGVIRGQVFRGEKVPLVADFLKICAETGMHPMFSVHPALTSSQWQNIKALAEKYNVLNILNIKGGSGDTIEIPMSVFGNEIESYTLDVNSSTTTAVEYVDSIVETYNIDTTKTKVGIEYFVAYATDERIAEVLDAGYFAAVANIALSNVYSDYVSYIEKGVTQFTDDYCPNVGLRWY